MKDLIERLERASEGSFDLDCAIFAAVHDLDVPFTHSLLTIPASFAVAIVLRELLP